MAFSSDEAKAQSQDREKQWVDVQIKGNGGPARTLARGPSLLSVGGARPAARARPLVFAFFCSVFSPPRSVVSPRVVREDWRAMGLASWRACGEGARLD